MARILSAVSIVFTASEKLELVDYVEPLHAPTPMGDQNRPTVYEQGGSWPIPAGDTSPPPLEPKGTADVRSICVVPCCHEFCHLAARN